MVNIIKLILFLSKGDGAMKMKFACCVIMIVCFYSCCAAMEGHLLTDNDAQLQAAAAAPSKLQNCFARYTLHILYLSTLLTAIIGGYFLGRYVKDELKLMEDNCKSMQSTCNDCSDGVAAIKPYLLVLANFTQGCPNAMSEFQTAVYFSMLNCRDENKCKPLPEFKKPDIQKNP